MRTALLVAAITVVAFFVVVVSSGAQEPTQTIVNIRGTGVATGVVIVSGQLATPVPGKRSSFELQCNKGMSLCNPLPPGTYTMVRLGKNRGMYDCVNVELYPKDANPEKDQQAGAYCLIEK